MRLFATSVPIYRPFLEAIQNYSSKYNVPGFSLYDRLNSPHMSLRIFKYFFLASILSFSLTFLACSIFDLKNPGLSVSMIYNEMSLYMFRIEYNNATRK